MWRESPGILAVWNYRKRCWDYYRQIVVGGVSWWAPIGSNGVAHCSN